MDPNSVRKQVQPGKACAARQEQPIVVALENHHYTYLTPPPGCKIPPTWLAGESNPDCAVIDLTGDGEGNSAGTPSVHTMLSYSPSRPCSSIEAPEPATPSVHSTTSSPTSCTYKRKASASSTACHSRAAHSKHPQGSSTPGITPGRHNAYLGTPRVVDDRIKNTNQSLQQAHGDTSPSVHDFIQTTPNQLQIGSATISVLDDAISRIAPTERLDGTPSVHTIQNQPVFDIDQAPGIHGKTPGRPLAHLGNPMTADEQPQDEHNLNSRTGTASPPGKPIENSAGRKRLYGKQADPCQKQVEGPNKPTTYKWTCQLCNITITSQRVHVVSVQKYKRFKYQHPDHKKTAEDKFHAHGKPQPDLAEPTITTTAASDAATTLTTSAINKHNCSSTPYLQTTQPPTFGCPKKRKRDFAKAVNKNWYNWCVSLLRERNLDQGRFQRSLLEEEHLKSVHNKKLTDCPSQGKAAITNRAIMRAKQMQEMAPPDAQHQLLHVKQNNLQACVPHQTTWICKLCLAKGTTAHMGNASCNPQANNTGRAKWLQGLTEDQSNQLQSTLGHSPEQWRQLQQQQASDLLAKSKKYPKRYASDKAYNDMLKVKRANWRKAHGWCASPHQASGATNSRNTYVPKARRALGLKAAVATTKNPEGDGHQSTKANKKQQTQSKPIQKGPSNTWTLDLTTCGAIEANPGPQSAFKLWQINIASYHLRQDILNTTIQEGIHAILMQETRLSDLEVECINRTNRNWQLFQAATATNHQSEAPRAGTVIFIRENSGQEIR